MFDRMPLSNEDIREILRIVDESDLSELQIETEGFALHVRKGPREVTDVGPPLGPAEVAGESTRARGGPPPSTPASSDEAHSLTGKLTSPGQPDDGLVTITAPMLGTFYRAEAPGKPPFVEVGARVEPDTIVCIIEVMKMMNSVTAGLSGKIAAVFPENAELVEYGEPLFQIEPA
jgi:acetyl-CoA carboxylase biotin carboxyl carrier protein